MTVSCPSDVVDAPVEIVWDLLTDPARWTSFYDLRVMKVHPPGVARVGQRVTGESGPEWLHLAVTVTFTAIDVPRARLGLEVRLPLGIAVKEELACSALSAYQCRVSYHCDFALPTGWRRIVARVLLRREFRVGPEDSLRRLKQAAEQRFRARHAD